ncbi:MAG: porin [Archangium sp.]
MTLLRLAFFPVVLSTFTFAQDLDAGTPEDDAGVIVAPLAAAPDAGTPAEPPLPVELKAKFGEGVTVRSGDFSVNVRGRFQLQATALVPTEGSTFQRSNQFVVRRARLLLKGEMPWHLSWTLHLGFSANDLEADAPNPIRDLYVQWTWLRDLSLRVGQMKVPFDVQRVVSSSSLQMVDRSAATLELNLDRDVGVQLYSDDLFGLGQRFRYSLGVWQGDGRNRFGQNIGLLYTARIRISPFGAIEDKVEGDIERSSKFRLAIGGGAARNIGSSRPRSTTGTPYLLKGGFDYTHATGDLHVKWNGLSLLAEIYWRQADLESRTGLSGGNMITEYSRSGWGWFAQAGGFVTNWLEFTARYGDLQPIGTTDPAFTRIREIGGGVNFFILKHDLKIQSDYFWLDDGTGHNGRHQIRVIAQLYF